MATLTAINNSDFDNSDNETRLVKATCHYLLTDTFLETYFNALHKRSELQKEVCAVALPMQEKDIKWAFKKADPRCKGGAFDSNNNKLDNMCNPNQEKDDKKYTPSACFDSFLAKKRADEKALAEGFLAGGITLAVLGYAGFLATLSKWAYDGRQLTEKSSSDQKPTKKQAILESRGNRSDKLAYLVDSGAIEFDKLPPSIKRKMLADLPLDTEVKAKGTGNDTRLVDQLEFKHGDIIIKGKNKYIYTDRVGWVRPTEGTLLVPKRVVELFKNPSELKFKTKSLLKSKAIPLTDALASGEVKINNNFDPKLAEINLQGEKPNFYDARRTALEIDSNMDNAWNEKNADKNMKKKKTSKSYFIGESTGFKNAFDKKLIANEGRFQVPADVNPNYKGTSVDKFNDGKIKPSQSFYQRAKNSRAYKSSSRKGLLVGLASLAVAIGGTVMAVEGGKGAYLTGNKVELEAFKNVLKGENQKEIMVTEDRVNRLQSFLADGIFDLDDANSCVDLIKADGKDNITYDKATQGSSSRMNRCYALVKVICDSYCLNSKVGQAINPSSSAIENFNYNDIHTNNFDRSRDDKFFTGGCAAGKCYEKLETMGKYVNCYAYWSSNTDSECRY